MHNCENNMIYKVEAKEIVTIEISILFDNNKSKAIIISKDDLVEVTYIEEITKTDIKTKTVRGKVSECNETFIVIDHSTLFNANITKIFIKEIRDIDKRDPEVMPLESVK